MDIRAVAEPDKLVYQDLLLLADEQMDMVERYLHRGEMFALWDQGEVKSICVVTQEGDGVYELKNMATRPSCQRQAMASAWSSSCWSTIEARETCCTWALATARKPWAFTRAVGLCPPMWCPGFSPTITTTPFLKTACSWWT